MTAWCLSAALEQLEKLRDFSSYFVGAGALSLLEKRKDLPFYGAEMERRRQLIRLRHGTQQRPEPHPVLTGATPSNRNPKFWGL